MLAVIWPILTNAFGFENPKTVGQWSVTQEKSLLWEWLNFGGNGEFVIFHFTIGSLKNTFSLNKIMVADFFSYVVSSFKQDLHKHPHNLPASNVYS